MTLVFKAWDYKMVPAFGVSKKTLNPSMRTLIYSVIFQTLAKSILLTGYMAEIRKSFWAMITSILEVKLIHCIWLKRPRIN